jgi:hypothetical protein
MQLTQQRDKRQDIVRLLRHPAEMRQLFLSAVTMNKMF